MAEKIKKVVLRPDVTIKGRFAINSDAVTLLKECAEGYKNELALCGFCARIGIQYSPDQLANREKILAFSNNQTNVMSSLTRIQADIQISSGFVSSESAVEIFPVLFPFLAFVVTPEKRETELSALTSFCRKFASFLQNKEDFSHFLGDERIGCQIDCAPVPSKVRVYADLTRELNKGFKKKQSQRAAEKSQKAQNKLNIPSEFEKAVFSAKDKVKSAKTLESKVDLLKDIFGKFKKVNHPAARTVEDLLSSLAGSLKEVPNSVVFKNLFLRGKDKTSGKKVFLLVSIPHDHSITYKELTKFSCESFGWNMKGDMRQATAEELSEILGVVPGEVSPLCLLHDSAKDVHFVSIAKVLTKLSTIWIHPFSNLATIGVEGDKLHWFLHTILSLKQNSHAFLDSDSVGKEETKEKKEHNAVKEMNMSGEEFSRFLKKKLKENGLEAKCEDLTKSTDFDPKARPKNHSTHNLLVKGKKTSSVYMITMLQKTKADLKSLAKLLNEKEIRFVDISNKKYKDLVCQEKGCLTMLTLLGNKVGKVQLVVQEELWNSEPNTCLRICAGCNDPLDHSQHNIVDVSLGTLKVLLNQSNTQKPTVLEF